MHLDKENKTKEKKPAVAAPEQRSGWRAVGEAVKASLPATMEGSASQTSGTPYGEEWNAARAREKNTRVERRGGKLRFGAAAVEEVSQSEVAINFQPFVGGGWAGSRRVSGPQTNKQGPLPPARLLPSTLTGLNATKTPSTLRHRRRESLAPLHRGNHDNNDGKKKRSLCGTFSCFPSVSRAVSDGGECGRAARTMGQFIAVRQQGCQGNLWAAAV